MAAILPGQRSSGALSSAAALVAGLEQVSKAEARLSPAATLSRFTSADIRPASPIMLAVSLGLMTRLPLRTYETVRLFVSVGEGGVSAVERLEQRRCGCERRDAAAGKARVRVLLSPSPFSLTVFKGPVAIPAQSELVLPCEGGRRERCKNVECCVGQHCWNGAAAR